MRGLPRRAGEASSKSCSACIDGCRGACGEEAAEPEGGGRIVARGVDVGLDERERQPTRERTGARGREPTAGTIERADASTRADEHGGREHAERDQPEHAELEKEPHVGVLGNARVEVEVPVLEDARLRTEAVA